jgi:DNA-binding NtrC family response regulator
MEKLVNYHWPGNIRELRNVIERAVIVSEEPQIKAQSLAIETTARPQSFQLVPTHIPEDGIDFVR